MLHPICTFFLDFICPSVNKVNGYDVNEQGSIPWSQQTSLLDIASTQPISSPYALL